MNQNNQCIYNNFYKTTVGRFYTKEQRLRLLLLFARAAGLSEESEEYNDLFNRIGVLEKQNISDYTDSKNYSMVSGLFLDDSEMSMAISALVSAHKCISDSKNLPYDNKVSWIIALRMSLPDDTERRMELALFEYSCGNVDAAVNELKHLVNLGTLSAMELLACICEENNEPEDAFYYYSLIKKVYNQELKMESPLATSERIDTFRYEISTQKADDITRDVESSPRFFEYGRANDAKIGFVSSEMRRFTYEH